MVDTRARWTMFGLVLSLVLVVAPACGGAGPAATANTPPTALIAASPTVGVAPLTVAFDGSGSFDPDGVVTAYAWAFGDGSGVSGAVVEHTYTQPGVYVATLAVTDDRGASRSATITITVDDGGSPGDGGGQEDSAAIDTARSFHRGTEAALELPASLIASAVDMALAATNLEGAATVTGTLTQTGPETFSYASEPDDLLRVVLLDGREFDITFAALNGTFSGDGDRFLREPHVIDITVTSNAAAGALDVRVTSSPSGAANTQQGTLVGAFTLQDGGRWTVDLHLGRFYRIEGELTGTDLESVRTMTGSVSSTAHNVAGTVDRYVRYRQVNTAENVDHRYDHRFTYDGVAYAMAGRIFVGLNSSKPVDKDQWVISGGLTRNGTAIGQFVADEDVSGLSVSLDVGGERLLLYAVSYF